MFLVKSIECHNLQHSLQLQVAFWKKQLHRSGAIQVDSCFSSKHRKKTKQQAGRPGWGRHSDWCRHQDSWHEVVSLLLDDAVSKNLWRMLSMAPKIQLLYGFVRSKRLQCSTSTTRDAFQIEESSPVPAAPTNQRNKWRSTSDRDVRIVWIFSFMFGGVCWVVWYVCWEVWCWVVAFFFLLYCSICVFIFFLI